MEARRARLIATILGVLGIVLILAGPAFHILSANYALFAGIVSFVVAAAIGGLAKKEDKDREKEQ